MKFALNRGSVILFSVLLFCVSCGDMDLFDTDKWSNKIEGWEPGVKAKVAHGTFTLWDLINQGDDDVIVKEGNDLIIQYLKPDIYNIKIEDIFNMPIQTIALEKEYEIETTSYLSGGIPVPAEGIRVNNIDIDALVKEIPDDCEITKLQASTELTFPDLGVHYQIKAQFPDIIMNGEMLQITRTLPDEGYSMNLNDMELTLDATKNVKFTITELFIFGGQTLDDITLKLNFGLKDLQFVKAVGKIQVPEITITRDSFNMDVDFLDEIGGTFKFTQPELNIILRNKGVGVPLSVDATFSGSNGDKSATLKLNDDKKLYTDGNRSNYEVPDTLGLNAENSNIVEFLSMPPKGDITYQGKVYVNPQGDVNNVIYNDAEVALDAYIRIPFSLTAENLSYKDTLNDIDIDQKYANKIKEGVIEIAGNNGLPLNLKIAKLILLDKNGAQLESLTATAGKDILKASDKGSIEFKINHDQAVKLGKTDRILLEAVATTGNQSVTIAADATLDFDLLITAKAVITDLDDF